MAALKEKCPKTLNSQFNEIFTLLASSVEFSCLGRTKTNDIRRDQILNGLNDSYKHSSTATKPENGFLFGANLESAMRSLENSIKNLATIF